MNKEIIVRHFEGRATAAEERELLNWINADRSNLEYFMQERKLWDALLVNGYSEEPLNTLNERFAKLSREINKDKAGPNPDKLLRRLPVLRRIMPFMRYAALFILGLLSYYVVTHIHDFSDPVAWNELTVPKGNRVCLLLPDSSTVWLNSQSKFRYPPKFEDNKREVWLNGEAFFEVHKNPKQRFIVHTSRLSVEAVGTSFNVLAYDSDTIFETALVTGKVKILREETGVPVRTLEPMQLAVYDQNSMELKVNKVDVDLYTCWKNGEFRFRNERLESIAHKLERYYNLKIEFGSNEIKDYRLTGTFPVSESWEKILTVIEKTTGAHYELKNRVALFQAVKPN